MISLFFLSVLSLSRVSLLTFLIVTQKRGLPRTAGHAEGAQTFRRIARYCKTLGIKYVTFYAFSTENWKRSQEEVGGIFNLLVKFVGSELAELSANNVKVHMLGDYEKVPQSAVKSIEKAVNATKDNTGLQFNIALNYVFISYLPPNLRSPLSRTD